MRLPLTLLLTALFAAPLPGWSQLPAAGQAAADPAPDEKDFRDTSRYAFKSVAGTTFDLQMLAYAMQLREFCANRTIPDDFVKERLARFSQMSGREEDCASLADY